MDKDKKISLKDFFTKNRKGNPIQWDVAALLTLSFGLILLLLALGVWATKGLLLLIFLAIYILTLIVGKFIN